MKASKRNAGLAGFVALLALSVVAVLYQITIQVGPVSKVKAYSSTKTVSDFGAVGNCVADDTAALEAAANAGAVVALEPGACYKITSTIDITTSNSGLIGDGTAKIYMPSANFNNTDPSTSGRYGSSAVGIHVRGGLSSPFTPISNVVLANLRIEYQQNATGKRVLNAIVLSNVVNPVVEGNEIYHFPNARAVVARSVKGGSISSNYIHDFRDESTGYSGTFPQITAIEIDNDPINSIPTERLKIQGNTISNLTFGSATLAAYGYQTDGINIARSTARHLNISNNIIDNVGEGIDMFGTDSVIAGNVVTKAYNFNIKLIHGASRNTVTGNALTDCGMACIVLGGQGSTGHVANNVISDNVMSNVDYLNAWGPSPGSPDTACIATFPDAPNYKAFNNTFQGNTCVPGTYGKYSLVRKAGGPNHYIYNLLPSGTAGDILSTGETGTLLGI